MSKEEALKNARRLVREAVDAAAEVGIDPASVVAPHCSETAAAQDEDGGGSKNLMLGEVPSVIDNDTVGLFEMPEPDDDPEQKPAFIVTQSTAELVQKDFERYKPSLERMAEDWEEKKERILSETKVDKE
jgi:molecular chaperone DnaK (HSP70)